MKDFIKILTILAIITLVSCNDNNPKILIIGDSISIGYTTYVRKQFNNSVNVYHISENGQHTEYGLENINKWISQENWAIIQFNWGLWDMCYRLANDKELGEKDKINGNQEVQIEKYKKNLISLVTILEKTNAKLVFVTTTYVPEQEPGIFTKDVMMYNDAAKEIMSMHHVPVNDIYNESIKIHKLHGRGPADVHYTKKGYQELSYLISDFLQKQF